MPRYVEITPQQLTPQKRYRVVNVHPRTDTVITATGPVDQVITETVPMPDVARDAGEARRVEMRPVALRFAGDITMAVVPRGGWELVSLEAEQEDLPQVAGSVILIGGRAAVLQDVSYSDSSPVLQWNWADGADSSIWPSEEELATATILYRGRA